MDNEKVRKGKKSSVQKRIYRIHDLVEIYGMSKATIYRLMDEGKFPRPVRISNRGVGWLMAPLDKWEHDLEGVE
ncbi:MAG: AlpA family phage regulatory protein [Desulfobulbaceae bacterium]|uniref:AlpA family phage regulatory protein n=1 Tax=Candidatus Desulfobia pelagia TaxID=2841692 RepID=A0A8J6NGB8_9BACT|nr:AlpA family phage regulatory protein [Candidatus Desulfobia pelagia]